MDKLIKRYIYDVIRRLPEKEQEEVSQELEANIYDMLSENASEEEVKEVLYELGSPAELAEKYRHSPKYLISPAIYEEYIKVLKWVLPVVGIVFLGIGVIIGAVESISDDGMIAINLFIKNLFTKGISMGISATLQTLVWTTIGFVIAERTGYRSKSTGDWKIEDLPELEKNAKHRIPLSDIIVELVLTTVFSILAILFFSGALPFDTLIKIGDMETSNIFTQGFMYACIPAIAILWLFNTIPCIVKLKERRWTLSVFITLLISYIVSITTFLFVIMQPKIFTSDFIVLVAKQEWANTGLLNFLKSPIQNPVTILVLIIIILVGIGECGMAAYRMLRNREHKNKF